MYQVKKPSHSEFIPLRNTTYHVQRWGQPQADAPLWVMVHGWMDVGASFQFVVDALQGDHCVIAPDWRGYGQTPAAQADHFWFADYLADLDFLLDHYAGSAAVNLVGHSMGGNVAMLYAGIRPQRVRKLVNLEGFGMPASLPAQAPGRYARWMDELKQLHRGELRMHSYSSADGVARRLMKTNPRLPQDKADWLARQWATPNAQGEWTIQGHPAHKISSAQLYRLDEVLAIYQRISMPTLAVEASDDSLTQWWKGSYTLEQYHERLRAVPQVEIARMEDAGHMLHHDQPAAVAALLERFLA